MMWVIVNKHGEFWSNVFGWVDRITSAERFTMAEANSCNLPMEGEWRRYDG